MIDESSLSPDATLQRQRALARWDNEGGATPGGSQANPGSIDPAMAIPVLTDSEWVAMHSRIIALENLVTSLLATATADQRDLARDMVGFITPRAGHTQHPLMIQAAANMVMLIERAQMFDHRAPS